jgi:diacylglycerol kinase family enzyme
VLVGGDGTFMAGVSALARRFQGALPPVSFVAGGTVATLARHWGVQGSLERAVARAVDGTELRAQERPSLLVEANGTRRVGFTFGTGLVARFFEEYYAAGAHGTRTAGGLFARVFVGSFLKTPLAERVLGPLPCRLSVDGETCSGGGYSLIVSSVLEEVGLGLRVTYRAGEDRNRLHLVASTAAPRELGPQALRVLRGRPLRPPGTLDRLVREFMVDFGTQPGPFVLDGDLYLGTCVRVAPGPTLTVLAD